MNIIRKFQPEDFPVVINIEQQVFNEHDPFYYMQFYETCSDGFIVAQINGLVVGFIVGFLTPENTGRIFSLAVLPHYRSKGIGAALLKEIIFFFQAAKAREVILEVRSENIKAKRFYERHGFSQIGILKKYYNDGGNAFLMKMSLN